MTRGDHSASRPTARLDAAVAVVVELTSEPPRHDAGNSGGYEPARRTPSLRAQSQTVEPEQREISRTHRRSHLQWISKGHDARGRRSLSRADDLGPFSRRNCARAS